MMNMSIRCRVCASPHCKTYEMERAKGKKFVTLAGLARRLEGQRIRAVVFKRHFEEHHGGVGNDR